MGTRSLTIVKDQDNKPIIKMYRQYDGYPSVHGQELAEFLKGIRIVNGIGSDRDKIANGMNCLAAQIVAHFKQEVGGFYLHPPTRSKRGAYGEEYTYTVYFKPAIGSDSMSPKGNLYVKCYDIWNKKVVYDATVDEILEMVQVD